MPPGWGQLKLGVAVGEGGAVIVGDWVGRIGVSVAGGCVAVGVGFGGTAVFIGVGKGVDSWETAVSSPKSHPIKLISKQKMNNTIPFFILLPLENAYNF